MCFMFYSEIIMLWLDFLVKQLGLPGLKTEEPDKPANLAGR